MSIISQPTPSQFQAMILDSGGRAHQIKQESNGSRIPDHPNPLALSKWYKAEIEWATEQIDSVEASHNIKHSCSKGCHACCYQPIMVSWNEMRSMIPAIKSLSGEARDELKGKIQHAIDELERQGMRHYNGNTPDTERSHYFNAHIPCPLLSDDGSCSMYDARPTTCAVYRNYGDPSDCQTMADPPLSLQFEDWESIVFTRLLKATKTKKVSDGLRLLPVRLKELFDELHY
ncbi:YkgJ family cysteine cluster protein [Cohnella soli]|uniref:YkgJ family cysteine cluster protein n=1 Tax=Cohnella soli TaxID=425005 RepID=A0ABW0HPY3_9BACL